MNASVDMASGDEGRVPVEACTLSTASQPLRLAEFDDLFAQTLTTVERVGDGRVRLVLSGPSGLQARAQDLADRETDCCSFFDFTVTTSEHDPRRVVVDAAVPVNRADVLAALTNRAEGHLAGQAGEVLR